MLEQFLSGFSSFAWSLAGVAVTFVCGVALKKLKGVSVEHKALVAHLDKAGGIEDDVADLKRLQKTQNAALREILGTMLDIEHARLVAQGYASPAEKMAFERLYKVYHALGGNGTRTSHYDDVMKMKAYPPEGEEQ